MDEKELMTPLSATHGSARCLSPYGAASMLDHRTGMTQENQLKLTLNS